MADMDNRYLLKLPLPQRGPLPTPRVQPSEFPHEQQVRRHRQTFAHLEQVLADLPAYRHDPSAIAPEKALVFVVKTSAHEFSEMLRNLSGREILGEEEVWELDEDETVPAAHIYLTMPTEESLHRILALWKIYEAGRPMKWGYGKWRDLFAHLSELRPWGPRDQLTKEAIFEFRKILNSDISTFVHLEAEIWYRGTKRERRDWEAGFRKLIKLSGGEVLDRLEIKEIEYLGILAKARREIVQSFLDDPDSALSSFQMVKFIVPQTQYNQFPDSLIALPDSYEAPSVSDPGKPPLVALLDGVPMSEHTTLRNRLRIDDPDSFTKEYSRAAQRIHGTSMASAIVHGDLNSPTAGKPLSRKLYVRPILHPPSDDAEHEKPPTNKLYLDFVRRAFIRMFGEDNVTEGEAPTVCLVNFSLGNSHLPFSRSITPWARLLDYLASKYNKLILVSAGNSPEPLAFRDISWDTLKELVPAKREGFMVRALYESRSRRRLLSPSESVNSLTIGALHSDALNQEQPDENVLQLHQDNHLPNMSSSLGLGYMRSVKPEVLFPGGREHVQRSLSHGENSIIAVPVGRSFGIGTATPPKAGNDPNMSTNYCSTSVATALATRGACQILEALMNTPQTPPHPDPDPQFFPVIAKTLIVHSARWNPIAYRRLYDALDFMGIPGIQHRDEITRIIGFGVADLNRVTHCELSRVTLLGWGFMPANAREIYKIPLPRELSGWLHPYNVTVTCAWITPINLASTVYRAARISVKLSKPSVRLDNPACGSQPKDNMCHRGTVFHRHWEIKRRKKNIIRDDLSIELHHKILPDSSHLRVPYALAVTIEDHGLESIRLYDLMRDAITVRVGD